MARIKYSEEVKPINNEHYGFTFQRNNYGQSMYPASRSKRFRRPRQNQRQHNNQKAVLQWRNMDPATKTAWNLFASTYQQPSKRQPTVFLTGYQLFIKRNSYCFLNHGIESDFMTAPQMEEKTYEETIFTLEAGDNIIDLTELYISNFGLLPAPGQWLLFCCIPYSDKSGQFFTPIFDTLEVMSVYVDGFFLNLTLPEESNDILYSVYLSKPVSAGQKYAGTKIRYMGCFTSKKFTALTDVPAVTPADAGKVWGVNPDGTLGWIEGGGGGGLTCEDLPECPTIISIENSIQNIASILSLSANTSIPVIKLGLLYNFNCARSLLLPSSPDWFLPRYVEDVFPWSTYMGGFSVAGGKIKEANLSYWNNITNHTNQYLLNFRGNGGRNSDGSFSLMTLRFQTWLQIYYGSAFWLYSDSGNANIATGDLNANVVKYGFGIRLCRLATGKADGVKGTYIGNNGNVYRTIVVNQKEWMADNLAETILKDGTQIPEITSNSAWIANTLPALCAYNNDWSNV